MVTKHPHKTGEGQKVSAPKEHQINGTRHTANITGTFNFDWNAFSQFVLTPTGAVTLGNTNLPTGTNSKEIKGIIKAGGAVTKPANWVATADSDAFDNTLDNHFRAWVSAENVVTFTNKNKAAGGGTGSGIQIIDAGTFTGEVNLSDGNYRYYDTYDGAAIAALTVSATKQLGSQAVLPIPGDKITDVATFIPEGWRYDGKPLSTNPAKINELRFELGKGDLVDVVNRVFDNENYVSPPEYIVWEDVIRATTEPNGTIGLPIPGGGGGWQSGGYSSKAINGNNAVLCESVGGSVIIALDDEFKTFSPSNLNREILAVLTTTGNWQVFEDEVNVSGTVSGYTLGNTVALRLTDGVVTFEINGIVVYTSGNTFTLPLTPVAILNENHPNGKILNARFETDNNLVTSPI